MERDEYLLFLPTLLYISTHTLTWSVTGVGGRIEKRQRFQLTRSRGAWLKLAKTCKIINTFQLTRSRGAWLIENVCQLFHVVISTHTLTWSVTKISMGYPSYDDEFQLTRSRGAWRLTFEFSITLLSNFNSHAHVERDSFLSSMTMTQEFQLTRSRGAWRYGLLVMDLWKVFQLTRSRGAWPLHRRIVQDKVSFQLTRSRGAWRDVVKVCCIPYKFQLTRSRGAWPVRLFSLTMQCSYFNSHAHVERDV